MRKLTAVIAVMALISSVSCGTVGSASVKCDNPAMDSLEETTIDNIYSTDDNMCTYYDEVNPSNEEFVPDYDSDITINQSGDVYYNMYDYKDTSYPTYDLTV